MTIDQAIYPDGTRHASLSPDGKHIASVIYNGTNFGLVIYDTTTLEARMVRAGGRVQDGFYIYTKAPREVIWVGNDLLAVNYGLVTETIDLDGKKGREIGEQFIGHAEPDNPTSANLLVYTDVKDGDIALVNARTGKRTDFDLPSGKAIRRAFDRRGQLRAITMVNSAFWKDVSLISNWYKRSADAKWEKLAEFRVTDDFWTPLYVPDEPDQLIISSRQQRDTYAIFNYDTRSRTVTEMLAGHPTQDILEFDGIEHSAFERVVTGGMIAQEVWLDGRWSSVQQAVDRALPNRINRLSGNPKENVLVYSFGDTEPGCWYLVDMRNGSIRMVARSNAAVAEATLQPMKVIDYRAPDGVKVPAFLTRPAGVTAAGPLVVLIHGGPNERDYWGWNAEVQLLVAQGYSVFQPQFRGSSGFGRHYEEAGYGQWGLAMQDDITAGVKYLIAQGIADPQRICIMGASYGGYAALWGLAKTPELYRCGVSFAGVTDITYMFRDGSDRVSRKVTREIMLRRIGDVASQAQHFDAVSPLKNARLIQAPVMLIHGELDVRVPISHAEKMKDALEDLGKPVEWLSFDDEEHGLSYVRNLKTYYTRLLAFLDRHIGMDKVKIEESAAAK